MGTGTESIAASRQALTSGQREAILHELNAIIASLSFKNSARSKEFLTYVVNQKLDGHDDLLKERTIGTQLFRREADYQTGEDPVVRVHAGDVRKRLERFYHSAQSASAVRIELPVGSYSPEFHWVPQTSPPQLVPVRNRNWYKWGVLVLVFSTLLITVIFERNLRITQSATPRSALDQFWAPVLATSQPVLICVAKPILYRPSLSLYRKYSNTHAGTFQTEVDRWSQPLLLDPNQKVLWRDILRYSDYGVAMGDVYAATELSALFARMNKPSQVRIGSNYSFEDLRNSPTVVIGAFNNHWTLQMTSNLRLVFVEHEGNFTIEEPGNPGTSRAWQMNSAGEIVKDYAIVSRLLDSKTGQVVIAAAGIGANGTRAAGEFISNRDDLERAFQDAPPDWSKKNVQVLLETTITDSVAGPPHVVKTVFW